MVVGQASAGDVAFVLTSFFVLQGYLRDIGTHIRNLQRSINDMEELVDFQSEPLGIEDRPGAKPIRITQGAISFDTVTFHYGNHRSPLYRDFSVDIAPGERVGLVASGSGKTTLLKLIQRLYDVNAGKILIDGQDISQVAQASLRGQIAIVQQEPILFHRSLAENIAYARPSATQEEIEHAAKLASAHDFITSQTDGLDTLVGERGRQAVGRRAAARGDRAGFPGRCAHPDPGRGDIEPRFGIGGADPAGDGTADGRPHHAGHRAPAVDGAGARPAAPPRDSAACGVCAYGPFRARQEAGHRRLFERLAMTVVAPSQVTLDFWRAQALPARHQLVGRRVAQSRQSRAEPNLPRAHRRA